MCAPRLFLFEESRRCVWVSPHGWRSRAWCASPARQPPPGHAGVRGSVSRPAQAGGDHHAAVPGHGLAWRAASRATARSSFALAGARARRGDSTPRRPATDVGDGIASTQVVAKGGRVSSVVVVATGSGDKTGRQPGDHLRGPSSTSRQFTFQCGEIAGAGSGGMHAIGAYDETRHLIAGVKLDCIAHVADRNGDGVAGAQVSFLTEAGTIGPSACPSPTWWATRSPLQDLAAAAEDVAPGIFTWNPQQGRHPHRRVHRPAVDAPVHLDGEPDRRLGQADRPDDGPPGAAPRRPHPPGQGEQPARQPGHDDRRHHGRGGLRRQQQQRHVRHRTSPSTTSPSPSSTTTTTAPGTPTSASSTPTATASGTGRTASTTPTPYLGAGAHPLDGHAARRRTCDRSPRQAGRPLRRPARRPLRATSGTSARAASSFLRGRPLVQQLAQNGDERRLRGGRGRRP